MVIVSQLTASSAAVVFLGLVSLAAAAAAAAVSRGASVELDSIHKRVPDDESSNSGQINLLN